MAAKEGKLMAYAILLVMVCAVHCHTEERNLGDYCEDHDICLGDTVCTIWKGCKWGTCACKPEHVRTTGNTCKKLQKHGGSCSVNHDCFTGVCTNKKCACAPGQEVRDDKKACGKFVGKSCSPASVSKDCSAYMECKDSKCACQASHKEEDKRCVPYDLGEDCSDGKSCRSPGRCTNNKCSCNNNLVPYLKYYCINKDATKDLGKGEACTSGGGTSANDKMCGKDLKCKVCPNESGKSVCAGAASIQAGLLTATFAAILAFLSL